MNPLLLVLPYCQKDVDLAIKLLHWMAELRSDYSPHSCLLVADAEVPHGDKMALQNGAKMLFEHVETIIVHVKPADQKWPNAANVMFANAARQVAEAYRLPWFWFEPDATPLAPSWLDDFADAYWKCAKRFMGALIPSNNQPDMPPLHLAGCAVYDNQAYKDLKQFTEMGKPFDIVSAGYTVPRAFNTPLMQHFWGKPDLAPTFKLTKVPGDPENTIPFAWIKPDARVMHRCKDGSLIELLRQKMASKSSKAAPEPEAKVISKPLSKSPALTSELTFR